MKQFLIVFVILFCFACEESGEPMPVYGCSGPSGPLICMSDRNAIQYCSTDNKYHHVDCDQGCRNMGYYYGYCKEEHLSDICLCFW